MSAAALSLWDRVARLLGRRPKIRPTVITAEWMNTVQEELMQKLLEKLPPPPTPRQTAEAIITPEFIDVLRSRASLPSLRAVSFPAVV